MEFLNTVIFPALATVLTGLATWGVAVFVDYLNDKIKNEKLRTLVENVRDIITAAVLKTSQTFVDDLKKNGEFSQEKQAEAFKITYKEVKRQLTEEAAAAINAISKDAESWIEAEIEKTVAERNKGG